MNIIDIQHRNQIRKYINNLDQPTICEIGTRDGAFFFDVLYTPNCKLGIMIDIWRDTDDPNQNDSGYSQQQLDQQYKNTFHKALNYNNIKIIREFSTKACHFFSDNTFDLIYIDADHSYNGCLEDLRSWYPKVKADGILAGHDFIDPILASKMGHKTTFGVVPAVKRFLHENNIEQNLLYITPETYGTYFIIKT